MCEDENTKKKFEESIAKYGDDIPIQKHPEIRSGEACHISSSKAIVWPKHGG